MKYFAYDILPELSFRTSRSGGSGGQHVNKTESKVEVSFDIQHSAILDETTREILLQKLGGKLTSGVLSVYSQEDRSQIKNREKAIEKLLALLDKAMVPTVKRKKTKITKAAKAKRKESKIKKSEVKENRKKFRY
jgi:ribosome-associated protein